MSDSMFDKLKNNTVLNATMLLTAAFPARTAYSQEPSPADVQHNGVATAPLDPRQANNPVYKQGVLDGMKLGKELAKVEAFVDYLDMHAQQTDRLVARVGGMQLGREWREDYQVIREDLKTVRESISLGNLDSRTTQRLMSRVMTDLGDWSVRVAENNRPAAAATAGSAPAATTQTGAQTPFAIPPVGLQGQGFMFGIYNPVEADMYFRYTRPILDKVYPQIEAFTNEIMDPAKGYTPERGAGKSLRDKLMREVEQNERDGKTMRRR